MEYRCGYDADFIAKRPEFAATVYYNAMNWRNAPVSHVCKYYEWLVDQHQEILHSKWKDRVSKTVVVMGKKHSSVPRKAVFDIDAEMDANFYRGKSVEAMVKRRAGE